MRQQEAEQEAARRNVEDERRDRFVFYALDHSAGLGDDAWEVELRLRTADDGPLAAAVPVAAATPAEPAAEPMILSEPPGAPEPLEPTEPLQPTEPIPAPEPVPAPTPPAPSESVPPPAPPAPRARRPAPDATPVPRRRRLRRPRLLQLWAAFVILVGLAFVAATIVLSVVLRDYTHFGAVPTSIGIGLGLIAVWIGVALARMS